MGPILAEIEVAHRMGVEVFVIDTGWCEKTGDWAASTSRFPRGRGPFRCNREFDVTCLKWDAIGQDGCDDPNYEYGTSANTPEERRAVCSAT